MAKSWIGFRSFLGQMGFPQFRILFRLFLGQVGFLSSTFSSDHSWDKMRFLRSSFSSDCPWDNWVSLIRLTSIMVRSELCHITSLICHPYLIYFKFGICLGRIHNIYLGHLHLFPFPIFNLLEKKRSMRAKSNKYQLGTHLKCHSTTLSTQKSF